LLLPEVFRRTWGTTAERFWPKATAAVRQDHPGFTFLAEAYWDLEWELQQQGFDYCYDKRLYDRLGQADAAAVRAHLGAGLDYQDRLARFLENHDEPRVASRFAWPRHQAAAMLTYFAPGLRFFYQGQREGARVRVPVHLCRGPAEPHDRDVTAFYDRLLGAVRATREGAWSLIAPREAWAGNPTWQDFIAYAWRAAHGECFVVVTNYSDHQAQCRLGLPFADLGGRRLRLVDVMGAEVYERDGDALTDPGLYIDLAAWRYNLFRLEAVGS
jgi:glycosidase